MNKSFQSYTPRVRAISYDALTLDTGCQIASGTKVLQLQPIIEICIAKHNPESAIYNQLETVNYFLGPDSIGSSAKPFTDSWAVWVATAGIRIGKFTTITPPSDSQGAAAPFYATMTPPHLSGAFNQDGFLAIAIQKTDATIEITHGESQGVASFIGQSPQLINDGILYASDTPGRSQVACIYVRGDRNDMLFARFENENFATEYIIVRATRSNIVKLLSITISALHFTIHGIDYLGRDVKMTSDDAATILLRFANGAAGSVVVSQVSPGRKNTLRLDVVGSRAGLEWSSENPEQLWIGHRDRANELLARDPSLLAQAAVGVSHYPGGHGEGFAETFLGFFGKVYAAVEAGVMPDPAPFATFSDGIVGLRLEEAIIESNNRGAWARVEGSSPHE